MLFRSASGTIVLLSIFPSVKADEFDVNLRSSYAYNPLGLAKQERAIAIQE